MDLCLSSEKLGKNKIGRSYIIKIYLLRINGKDMCFKEVSPDWNGIVELPLYKKKIEQSGIVERVDEKRNYFFQDPKDRIKPKMLCVGKLKNSL